MGADVSCSVGSSVAVGACVGSGVGCSVGSSVGVVNKVVSLVFIIVVLSVAVATGPASRTPHPAAMHIPTTVIIIYKEMILLFFIGNRLSPCIEWLCRVNYKWICGRSQLSQAFPHSAMKFAHFLAGEEACV